MAERHFAELGRVIGRAHRTTEDPVLALVAGCRAYCRFAIRHPGEYRTLFEVARPDLGPAAAYSLEQSPGRRVLDALAEAIQGCLQLEDARLSDSHFLAVLLWAALHGIVSLHYSRPRFPWPPMDRMVEEIVHRLLDIH